MGQSVNLKISIDDVEYRALVKIAQSEMRSLEQQIRFMLRQELEERGVIDPLVISNVIESPVKKQGR